ncbi:LPS O-antigen chain length determinant protein WzzB, partial [Escherichia coli]|nr:LPS O-antigen chain length determinant protein WzzB [Escherichia coli]
CWIEHIKIRQLHKSMYRLNYYQTRQNLLDIDNLDVDKLDIHAYRYVMKPTLPIRRDSPKKAITLILAVLLGGMVGAGIVLGRNALRNYNAK